MKTSSCVIDFVRHRSLISEVDFCMKQGSSFSFCLSVLFSYRYPIVPAPLKKAFSLLIHHSTSQHIREILLLDLYLPSIVLSIWISLLFHCFASPSEQKPHCLYLQITIRSLFFFSLLIRSLDVYQNKSFCFTLQDCLGYFLFFCFFLQLSLSCQSNFCDSVCCKKNKCPDMIFIWIALHFISQLWENQHLYILFYFFHPKAFYFFKLLILIRVQSITNIEIVSSGPLRTQPCNTCIHSPSNSPPIQVAM